MPQFSYIAVDPNGRRVRETISADSKVEIANTLKKNNFFIVEISEVAAKDSRMPKRLSLSEKLFFTQNVATLLASGMPLSSSLTAISEDTSNKQAISLYGAIRSDLERGLPFYKALSRYPEIFDSVYVSLIEAGENSGKLDTIMDSLAKRLEKDARITSQVRSAFLYPSFILVALVILGGLIMGFVLPKLIPVFEELKVKLPITTKILLGISKFMIHHPYIVLGLILGAIIATIFFMRSYRGRLLIGVMANRTPFIRQMIMYLDLTRLSSTMAILLEAGVPIQKAMKIAANTIRTPLLRQQVSNVSEDISRGTSLATSLRSTSLPKTFIALVAIGERSGNSDFIFKMLGQHYEDMLDSSVKNFTSLIEPVLTLVVGLIVGGTVLSVMVPIYQVVGTIGGK